MWRKPPCGSLQLYEWKEIYEQANTDIGYQDRGFVLINLCDKILG
jgi:hypothetical protein